MKKSIETIVKYTPPTLLENGVATKFKELNNAYAIVLETTEDDAELYGNIQDLEHNTGVYLDATAKVYNTFRLQNETDDELRERIKTKVISGFSGCSLIEINNGIRQQHPNITVIENYQNRPASIAINGGEDLEQFMIAFNLANSLRAAGIRVLVYIYETGANWGNVNNTFNSWGHASLVQW